ncbi:unnamed protein product [Parascedosporium putredinis]|uniref:Acyltransferase 3 domain-containing protein n=1 Tax=Parascedosporium putredinis TaxID=1442378 RepID=A0A9P1H2A2_9PEZI|nr:unnamed protein product [Parascedosporium putredinis]CAI7993451.1 unnamed protein product [Parascedosporium putredinis]
MGLKFPSATLRPRALINLAIWLLSCLLHPTSYLDGLRGLAACAVFAFHYTDYNHKSFLPHYGGNGDAGSSLIQLPFLRLIYSGAPMVHVFFVISGFALSCRPLQALYARPAISTAPSSFSSAAPTSAAVAKSLAILSSSALRRPIRLLLDLLHGFMKPKDTVFEALYEWAHDALKNLAWPWNFDAGSLRSRYDPHLWTIPIELSHSLFLFLVAGRYAVLVFSLFILSYPPRREDMTPAYLWLERFTLSSFVKEKSDLPSRFWLALAAFGTLPVPQYAGRISFCFYLMQHAVLNMFQHHTLGATGRPASNKNPAEPAWGVRGTFGNTTPVERTMTWFAGLAILGTILVIVSDLGTRALDAPAVKLARRVEGYLCHRDEPRRSADQEK